MPFRWFHPEAQLDAVKEFMVQTAGAVDQTLDCLDLFGASGRIRTMWKLHGYEAESYDIKLSADHDLCKEVGFKCLISMCMQFLVIWSAFFADLGVRGIMGLPVIVYVCLYQKAFIHLNTPWTFIYHHEPTKGISRLTYLQIMFVCLSASWLILRLKEGALIAAQPPCSLMGPACSSVHRRTSANPAGDRTRFKVRLAERIWRSFAAGPILVVYCNSGLIPYFIA